MSRAAAAPKSARRVKAEAPVAVAQPPEPPTVRMHRALTKSEANSLARLLAGGLYTGPEEGLAPQDAAIRVAAAQLRAIRFALAFDQENTDSPDCPDNRQSWCMGDSFGVADAVIALGGVTAMLEEAWYLGSAVRHARDEHELAESEAAQ